ncbi:MAG TPA: PqqD family protein [Bradyrhizobium sp.]|nr:PqqD family protein [Bradyrhizobium sp.]
MPVSALGASAVALGLAPRLRCPIPAELAPAFHQFVNTHRGPHDDEFLYLDLPPTLLAPHGQRANIEAIILLDRKKDASPELKPIPRGLGLRQLLLQNFAPNGTSEKTLAGFHSLIGQIPCFKLVYADLEKAAALLIEQFTNAPRWPDRQAEEKRTFAAPVCVFPARGRARRTFIGTVDVAMRNVDGEYFLVSPDQRGLLHLNEIAARLWDMLKYPTTAAAAVRMLSKAFPEADIRRIKRDVRKVFDALRVSQVIRIHSPTATRQMTR